MTTEDKTYEKAFKWELDFRLNVGQSDQRFLDGLKERRILGNECPDCGTVFVPPQGYCDECFVEPEKWSERGPEAVVESYSVTFREFMNMPETPYVNGVIRVGDSDTCFLHFIGGIEYDEPEDLIDAVEVGTRVRPVWRDDRDGSIHDIEYFEPVAQN